MYFGSGIPAFKKVKMRPTKTLTNASSNQTHPYSKAWCRDNEEGK